MMINSIGYILRETFRSMIRNPWLSVASVLTIMVSLVILGSSLFFLANAAHVAESFESQLEIAVFVQDHVSQEEVGQIEEQIKNLDGVSSVVLVSKEQALLDFGKTMGSSDLMTDLGGINPFPDMFTVHTLNPQEVNSVAQKLANLTGVDKVRYGQGVVDNLISFTKWLRWIGLAVVIAFAAASLVLIALNIRMNVFSRRREIQVMKMVGASNSFIRWPFFIEGLLLGLIGAVLSSLIVAFGYQWLIDYLRTTLTFLPVVDEPTFSLKVTGLLIATGMSIGAIGSAFSLRKFLHV